MVVLKQAFFLYKKQFKIIFSLAFILSFVSECFKTYLINKGLLDLISSPDAMESADSSLTLTFTLMFFVLLILMLIVYGLSVILIGLSFPEKNSALDNLKQSFQIFILRLPKLILLFILYSFVTIALVLSPLSIIGLYISVILFLTTMPMVLLEGKNAFESVKLNFQLLTNNVASFLGVTFIVMMLMILKPILIYSILTLLGSSNSLLMSLDNILTVVIESFIMPFTLSVMVSAYIYLKANNSPE